MNSEQAITIVALVFCLGNAVLGMKVKEYFAAIGWITALFYGVCFYGAKYL